jgi:futalosine hydrolase
MRLLVVTSVPAEAAAVRRGLSHEDSQVHIEVGGVGPAIAAASTARLLALAEAAGDPYAAVVCAGIAGGFVDGAPVGSTVVATRAVAADLGSDSPDGFIPLAELGFGVSTVDGDLPVVLPGAVVGEVLTVSTVTGTAERAAQLRRRHPAAVAEAMEGYGVGIAAVLAGVGFAEIRTIANPVGPRDRGAWRIDEALAALTAAARALGPLARGLT